jgi:hypothetical protein
MVEVVLPYVYIASNLQDALKYVVANVKCILTSRYTISSWKGSFQFNI